jgi:hypothetical protein
MKEIKKFLFINDSDNQFSIMIRVKLMVEIYNVY